MNRQVCQKFQRILFDQNNYIWDLFEIHLFYWNWKFFAENKVKVSWNSIMESMNSTKKYGEIYE